METVQKPPWRFSNDLQLARNGIRGGSIARWSALAGNAGC